MSAEHLDTPETKRNDDAEPADDTAPSTLAGGESPREVGGRAGPDPTRYGDWEKNGRCIDF